jgi:HAMP domain-containing protein
MSTEAPKVNVEQAAAEVGNLLRMFKGVQDAHTVIEALRAAGQVERETQAAITAAKRTLTRVQNEIGAAQAEAGRIRDEANFALSAAKAESERMLADTKVTADAMFGDAAAKAAQAQAEVADARRTLDSLLQQQGIVRAELARLEDARRNVLAALSGAQATVADAPGP